MVTVAMDMPYSICVAKLVSRILYNNNTSQSYQYNFLQVYTCAHTHEACNLRASRQAIQSNFGGVYTHETLAIKYKNTVEYNSQNTVILNMQFTEWMDLILSIRTVFG